MIKEIPACKKDHEMEKKYWDQLHWKQKPDISDFTPKISNLVPKTLGSILNYFVKFFFWNSKLAVIKSKSNLMGNFYFFWSLVQSISKYQTKIYM